MGPTPPKVESGPPKVIESLVWLVLPPVCRESVVGDLHERYKSLSGYLRDAILSVPLVIVSRIKRTTDAGLLLLEGLAFYVFFVASAWRYEFLEEPNAYLRLAVPVLAVLLALIVVDAYAPTERLVFYDPAAAIAAIWVHTMLTRSHVDWAFPSVVVLLATAIGVILVGSVRAARGPGDHRATGA